MQFPAETRNEHVEVTCTNLAATESIVIDRYAIKIEVIVPASTSATIQTLRDPGDTETSITVVGAATKTLDAFGRAMTNDFEITNSAGAGVVKVMSYRVAGKPATDPAV